MTCPLRAIALEEGLVRHYAQETRVAGRGRSIGWIGSGSESGGTEADLNPVDIGLPKRHGIETARRVRKLVPDSKRRGARSS